MKKSLLATVAGVSLLAGTGMVSAEGSKEQSGMKSGTELNKGADSKAGADAKADSKASPSTTGQSTTDQKSGNDAPKPSTQNQQPPAARSSAQGQAQPNSTQGRSSQGQSTQRQSDTSSSAGASVNLTTEQKTKIRSTVIQSSHAPKVSRSQINFNLRPGTVVPRTVRFEEVPPALVEIHPQWRGYRYFVVDDEIVVVDPRTLKIVAILEV